MIGGTNAPAIVRFGVVIVIGSAHGTGDPLTKGFVDDAILRADRDRRDYLDRARDRRFDEESRRFVEESRRHMHVQAHRPPPVLIELAAISVRVAPLRSIARRRPWLLHARSAPRARRPRRRRIRVWERSS